MKKNNYYLLTCAFGSGKSTVLELFKNKGLICVNEPAREILAAQRADKGRGVPETDPALFTGLMMDYSVNTYLKFEIESSFVIFDR